MYETNIATQNSRQNLAKLNPDAIEFHPGLQCHPIRLKRPPGRRRRSYGTKFNPQVEKVLSAVEGGVFLPKVPQSDLQAYLEKMGVMKKDLPKATPKATPVKDDKLQIVQQLFRQVQRTRLISSVY